MSVPTLAEDHALLCAATRAGGAIAKDFFGGPLEVRDKTPGDPVSEADLAGDVTPEGGVAPSKAPAMRARESLVRALFSHNDFITIH